MQNFITESIHLPEGATAQIAEVAAQTGETYEEAQRRVVAAGLAALQPAATAPAAAA